MSNIKESDYIETDEQYNTGCAINIYNEKVSIVRAEKNDKGLWMSWMFPAVRGEPGKKMFPHQIPIGNNVEEAIRTLETMLGVLGGASTTTSGSDEGEKVEKEDLPF